MSSKEVQLLMLEPFYSGSHKGLLDALKLEFNEEAVCYTMKGSKWHWRARTAALYFAQTIHRPISASIKTLFASSVLNLAELCSLRSDLCRLKKVLYFHENQLIYPRQQEKERDFQYGYNQVLSCLVADVILFNSKFNKSSFLSNMKKFFKLMPDYRPKNLEELIEPKCQVLYYPITFVRSQFENVDCDRVLHILWNHRWEHDKCPEDFFRILFQLKTANFVFKVSVVGENYNEIPDVFEEAKVALKDEIVNWGYVQSREEYWNILKLADVVISTARHEFYGVSMIEAAKQGCFPLCPNRLVYPEIFPRICLYDNEEQLLSILQRFANDISSIPKVDIDFDRFNSETLLPKFRQLLMSDN